EPDGRGDRVRGGGPPAAVHAAAVADGRGGVADRGVAVAAELRAGAERGRGHGPGPAEGEPAACRAGAPAAADRADRVASRPLTAGPALRPPPRPEAENGQAWQEAAPP